MTQSGASRLRVLWAGWRKSYVSGETHPEENYGIIEITDKSVLIYLKNIDGKILESAELMISSLNNIKVTT